MRVLVALVISSGLVGCPAFFPPGDLPAVPYHQLPSSVAELHELADRTYRRSRAEKDLVRARSALRKAEHLAPNNYETLWRLARIDGVLARTSERHGEKWAIEGREASERAVALSQESVEGHLYLAICSGLLARHQPRNADELLNTTVAAAKTSAKIAPHFAQGEARRILGAIYTYAPPWPSGIGDLDEAVDVLEALVKDHPQEPLNFFYLAEAYRKADQRADAIRLYRKVRRFKPRGLWRIEGAPYRQQSKQNIIQLKRSK